MPRLAQAQELSEVVAKIEAGDALTVVEAKIMEGGIQTFFMPKRLIAHAAHALAAINSVAIKTGVVEAVFASQSNCMSGDCLQNLILFHQVKQTLFTQCQFAVSMPKIH